MTPLPLRPGDEKWTVVPEFVEVHEHVLHTVVLHLIFLALHLLLLPHHLFLQQSLLGTLLHFLLLLKIILKVDAHPSRLHLHLRLCYLLHSVICYDLCCLCLPFYCLLEFFDKHVLELRLFLAWVLPTLVEHQRFVPIFHHVLRPCVRKLLDGGRPFFASLFDAVQKGQIFYSRPFSMDFFGVQVVHPSLTTLLRVSEIALARLNKEFSRDRIPLILGLLSPG